MVMKQVLVCAGVPITDEFKFIHDWAGGVPEVPATCKI